MNALPDSSKTPTLDTPLKGSISLPEQLASTAGISEISFTTLREYCIAVAISSSILRISAQGYYAAMRFATNLINNLDEKERKKMAEEALGYYEQSSPDYPELPPTLRKFNATVEKQYMDAISFQGSNLALIADVRRELSDSDRSAFDDLLNGNIRHVMIQQAMMSADRSMAHQSRFNFLYENPKAMTERDKLWIIDQIQIIVRQIQQSLSVL